MGNPVAYVSSGLEKEEAPFFSAIPRRIHLNLDSRARSKDMTEGHDLDSGQLPLASGQGASVFFEVIFDRSQLGGVGRQMPLSRSEPTPLYVEFIAVRPDFAQGDLKLSFFGV